MDTVTPATPEPMQERQKSQSEIERLTGKLVSRLQVRNPNQKSEIGIDIFESSYDPDSQKLAGISKAKEWTKVGKGKKKKCVGRGGSTVWVVEYGTWVFTTKY